MAHNLALDLFLYSRPGVSYFLFEPTQLLPWQKSLFELCLMVFVLAAGWAFYGRGTKILAPAPRLIARWQNGSTVVGQREAATPAQATD